MANYLTAIIVCKKKQVNGNCFLKYRNIINSSSPRRSFENFAKKFPGASHINYYDKKTKKFVEQIKLL
jgi:hypothetical protein